MVDIIFKHGEKAANIDCKTFFAWERKDISTGTATKRINENNHSDLIEEEFIELAHSLGYYRHSGKDEDNYDEED